MTFANLKSQYFMRSNFLNFDDESLYDVGYTFFSYNPIITKYIFS